MIVSRKYFDTLNEIYVISHPPKEQKTPTNLLSLCTVMNKIGIIKL